MVLSPKLLMVSSVFRLTKPQVVSLSLLLVYFIARFPLSSLLDQLGPYSSYVFEFLYALIALFLFRKRISFKIPASRKSSFDLGFSLVAGFAIYALAGPLKLVVPFDLSSIEIVILLLFVAPLLEEMIFRFALWELLSEFCKKRAFLLASTSALFAFSHLVAWWSVPEEFKSFVIYQTIYTFPLALYCGTRRIETGGLGMPILIHFLFNLGFFLGSYL